jgi:hypothetical protein
MKILIPVSLGELYDKISILDIKSGHISDITKLVNIIKEMELLKPAAEDFPIDDKLYSKLLNVNFQLWNVEDMIREKERNEEFDENFILYAREIYHLNDKRSEIKKEINLKYDSDIIEEKSYKKYE